MLRRLFAVLFLAFAPAAASADPVPWLNLDADLLAHWKVQLDPADPNRLTLSREDGAGAAAPTRLLVLVPWASSAYDTALSTLMSSFADHKRPARFTVISMDGKLERGVEILKAAQADGYQMIFAMGSESAQMAHDSYRGGPLPVITVCAKDPVQLGQLRDYDRGSGTNIAYTSLNMPTDAQFSYLLQLMPDVHNIAILVDDLNKSAMETQARPLEAAARARGINALVLGVHARKGMRDQMPKLMADAITAMKATDPQLRRSFFWITGSTAVFTEIGIINSNAGPVPVLSVVPDVVTPGAESAALAVGISFESNARLAAAYAFAILDQRSKPGALKVGVVEPPDIAINFLKARQAGLKIPYPFFELAWFVYDGEGKAARIKGRDLLAGR